jgi:hypothetical protein
MYSPTPEATTKVSFVLAVSAYAAMSPRAETIQMSNKQGVSGSTRVVTEEAAFEQYLSVLRLAYEKDGLVGAVQASAAVVREYDQIAAAAEKEVSSNGGRDMVRAVAASTLVMEVLPSFSKAFAEV